MKACRPWNGWYRSYSKPISNFIHKAFVTRSNIHFPILPGRWRWQGTHLWSVRHQLRDLGGALDSWFREPQVSFPTLSSYREYRPSCTHRAIMRQEAAGWSLAGEKDGKAWVCKGITELVWTLTWEGGFLELFLDILFICSPNEFQLLLVKSF